MKVVILHTDFRIYWPARIYALQQILKKNNMELHVVEIAGEGSPYSFADKKTDYAIDNWNILFPNSKMENLSMSVTKKAILKELNKINPDVVIAGAIAFPSGAISTLWCKRNGKKVIIFDDAKIADVKRGGLVNFIKRRIYHNVDAMLYPSKEWDSTGLYWEFKKEQIFYGVDVVDNDFWALNNDNFKYKNYFLFVGRQIEVKNIFFLLKAYLKYSEIVDNPKKLIIVGNGPLRKNIESFIKDNKLNKVILIDFVQQKELPSIYKNATAFILPSFSETWGLVINEALASGCPVLASKKCGATDSLIIDGKNGYSFDPYDIDDLLNKMLLINSMDQNSWNKLSQNALLKSKEFSTDLFASSLLNAINYVSKSKKNHICLLDYLIINLWKGRYNPI